MNRIRQFFPSLAASLLLSLVVGCSAKAKLENHLKRADEYHEKGDFERARIEYLNAFQLNRGNSHVATRLGGYYLEAGDPQNAFQFFSHALAVNPSNHEARTKLALLYLLAGRKEDAIKEVEEVLKSAPENNEALVLRANAATTPDDVAATLKRFQSMAIPGSTNAAMYLSIGILQQRSGDLAAAEASYSKAVQVDPSSSGGYLTLGVFYWDRGETNKAAEPLRRAMDLAPYKSSERLRYSDFLTRTGRIEEGEKLLLEAVEKEPRFVGAYNALTRLALARGDLATAEQYSSEALTKDRKNRDAQLNSAKVKLAKKEFKLAAEELTSMAESRPRDHEVRYFLAAAELGNNSVPAALAALNGALALQPTHLESLLLRAQVHRAGGDIDSAVTDLRSAVKEHSKNPQPYYLLANSYAARGNLDLAIDLYKALAQLTPDDPNPHRLLAAAYAQQNRVQQARQSYENALKLNPDLVPVVEQLVNLDISAKAYSDAASRIGTYIEKHPSQPAFPLLQAKLLLAQGRHAESERWIRKSLEIDPDYSPAFHYLAEIQRASGNPEKAIDQYEELVEKNDKDLLAWLQLAMAQEAQKDFSAAQKSYRKVISLNPRQFLALNNLAGLMIEHGGDVNEALEFARRAQTLAPGNAAAADTYGWALYKSGNYERALKLLLEASASLPQHPEVNYHLGMAHYMTGASAPALTALTKALNSTNQFSGEATAKRAVEILQLDPSRASTDVIATLQKFISENPADVYAQTKLAQVFEARSDWARARECYESALKAVPQSALTLARLAALHAGPLADPVAGLETAKRAWAAGASADLAAILGPIGYRAGDLRWAYDVLLEAQRGSPNNPEVQFYIGAAAYALNRLSQSMEMLAAAGKTTKLSTNLITLAQAGYALVSFHAGNKVPVDQVQSALSRARALDPTFPPALVGSGLLAERSGDYTAARMHYEAALNARPGLPVAQRQLAILLAEKLSDDPRAEQLGAPLRIEFPNDPELAKALGKVAYRRGNYRDSVRLLDIAFENYPEDAELLYHLGLSQMHLSDVAGKATLERAIVIQPSSSLAPEARKALASGK